MKFFCEKFHKGPFQDKIDLTDCFLNKLRPSLFQAQSGSQHWWFLGEKKTFKTKFLYEQINKKGLPYCRLW